MSGMTDSGLDELTVKGQDAEPDSIETVGHINTAFDKLNDEDEVSPNSKDTIAHSNINVLSAEDNTEAKKTKDEPAKTVGMFQLVSDQSCDAVHARAINRLREPHMRLGSKLF